jgi:hypothetical protein
MPSTPDERADEILAWQQTFDWMTGKYTLRLERVSPAKDKNGNLTRGFLHTWNHPVAIDEIHSLFGGGEYVLFVRGPSRLDKKQIATFLGAQSFGLPGPALNLSKRPKDDLPPREPNWTAKKPPPPTRKRADDLPRQEELVASGDAGIVFNEEAVDVADIIPAAPLLKTPNEPDSFK